LIHDSNKSENQKERWVFFSPHRHPQAASHAL
jgi:hypothetical protein